MALPSLAPEQPPGRIPTRPPDSPKATVSDVAAKKTEKLPVAARDVVSCVEERYYMA
jgi:hypothetical protein